MSTPASIKKRRAGTSLTNTAGAAQGQGGMMRFYNDDAPGLKIGPTTVLVLSLSFIAFVVLLHIWGKLASKVTSS